VARVRDVNDCGPRFQARRIVLPSCGVESWTLIGPDLRPVAVVDEFLAWLTHVERSPNTVEAYARDLKAFWCFLDERGLAWDRNKKAREIDRALTVLEDASRLQRITTSDGRGRPAETWRPARAA
jgi:hypothetical protein